jgi:predicted metal-dependent hydrolase
MRTGCYGRRVSKKSAKIAALIAECEGGAHDAHYVGYFACFNLGLFYESHDVLEELWLKQRRGPNDGFYKGLIQFAGAFVHLQKNRLRPAAALFKLSRSYLSQYPARHQDLNVGGILATIQTWLERLEAGGFTHNPLTVHSPPTLSLEGHVTTGPVSH